MSTSVPVNAHLIESITSALSVSMKCPTTNPRHSEFVNLNSLAARRRYLNADVRANMPEFTEAQDVSRDPLHANHLSYRPVHSASSKVSVQAKSVTDDYSDQRRSANPSSVQLEPEMDCSATAVD
jgi:hypothetical protein